MIGFIRREVQYPAAVSFRVQVVPMSGIPEAPRTASSCLAPCSCRRFPRSMPLSSRAGGAGDRLGFPRLPCGCDPILPTASSWLPPLSRPGRSGEWLGPPRVRCGSPSPSTAGFVMANSSLHVQIAMVSGSVPCRICCCLIAEQVSPSPIPSPTFSRSYRRVMPRKDAV